MSKFNKGDLVQRVYDKKNFFILVEELEHNVFFCIRVKRKDGRFDIKKTCFLNIKNSSKIDIENFNLDKRDLDIFNEFRTYIKNTVFKVSFKIYEYKYTHFKPTISIRQFIDFKININLSKYKKYSNKI